MNARTLVLGSTGKTGRRIVERLQRRQETFRPGSRGWKVPFHWEDASNWSDLLQGIEQVYISFQPDLAVPYAFDRLKLFVVAARVNGVRKLVLLSGRGEAEAQACEELIIQSGLDWTILRCSWFMQNFSESFLLDSILANEVVLPVITAKEPFIDAEDIADVAVSALLDNGHAGKIYELTGPELLSFQEATARIARATGRLIAYREIYMKEYTAALKSYQVPDEQIRLMEYLFTEVLDGRNESLTDDVERVLNRKPTGFDAYVSKTMQTGVWGGRVETLS